ncbi:Hypothetical predicted protein [Pelobates cultripes]|uniref:Uncharacterized protein n=1 Tax=Pelobates cultripes TaxID=61616 RepID=A0AAD1RCP5_PELCU|nr:Hypothetical predicted protein [Pelobates cultripes]
MTTPLQRPKQRHWRLNEATLVDNEMTLQIRNTLNHYFSDNETTEVAQPMIWEAHKSSIRGTFISLCTHHKREKVRDLLNRIEDLTGQHKQDQTTKEYKDLLEAQRKLRTHLTQTNYLLLQKS